MCDFDTCQTNCEGQSRKAGRFKASLENKVNPINQTIAKFVDCSRSHASLKALISHSFDICPIETCDVTEEEFADNSPVKCKASKQRNCRTKRDREPSRIPVNKLLRKFKNERLKANFKYQFMNSVPNTSFIMNFCKNYNKVSFWCRSEHYYSKYVFFVKK